MKIEFLLLFVLFVGTIFAAGLDKGSSSHLKEFLHRKCLSLIERRLNPKCQQEQSRVSATHLFHYNVKRSPEEENDQFSPWVGKKKKRASSIDPEDEAIDMLDDVGPPQFSGKGLGFSSNKFEPNHLSAFEKRTFDWDRLKRGNDAFNWDRLKRANDAFNWDRLKRGNDAFNWDRLKRLDSFNWERLKRGNDAFNWDRLKRGNDAFNWDRLKRGNDAFNWDRLKRGKMDFNWDRLKRTIEIFPHDRQTKSIHEDFMWDRL